MHNTIILENSCPRVKNSSGGFKARHQNQYEHRFRTTTKDSPFLEALYILCTNYKRIMRLPCSFAFVLAAGAPRRVDGFVSGPTSLRTAAVGGGVRTVQRNMRMSGQVTYSCTSIIIRRSVQRVGWSSRALHSSGRIPSSFVVSRRGRVLKIWCRNRGMEFSPKNHTRASQMRYFMCGTRESMRVVGALSCTECIVDYDTVCTRTDCNLSNASMHSMYCTTVVLYLDS